MQRNLTEMYVMFYKMSYSLMIVAGASYFHDFFSHVPEVCVKSATSANARAGERPAREGLDGQVECDAACPQSISMFHGNLEML
jgi:hypothetical protein